MRKKGSKIEREEELRVVVILRCDLLLSRGKMAVQVAHAASEIVFSHPDRQALSKWRAEGQTKIILGVPDVEELQLRREKAAEAGLHVIEIHDSARNELKRPTTTAIGIGPGTPRQLIVVTKGLELFQ